MKLDTSVTALEAEVLSVADRHALESFPQGFLCLPGGVYEASADEAAEPSWLCSPLAVATRFREPSGKNWGRIIEIDDPDGRVQRISLFDRDLVAKPGAVRADLVSRGLQTHSSSKSREALTRLIREWKPAKTLTSTHRLGWTDGSG